LWPRSPISATAELLFYLLFITCCVCVIDYLRLIHFLNIIAFRPVLCFVYDVYNLMLLCDCQSFIKESYYYSGLWSRSRRLGLETVSRRTNVSSRSHLDDNCQRLGLVSVSAINVSCPRPIFRQILQVTIIKLIKSVVAVNKIFSRDGLMRPTRSRLSKGNLSNLYS